MLVTLATPLLANLSSRFGYLRAGLDGFVLMTVIGLVVLVLLPDALFHRGHWALLVLVVGFFLPAIAEYIGHKRGDDDKDCHQAQRKTHKFILVMSSLAIILHAITDGAILALANDEAASDFLSVGVVAHRVGIALTLWWLLMPYLSSRTIYLMLVLFALVTYLGFAMADTVFGLAEYSLAGYWQAFAAGSLLHVVMHPLRERNIPPAVIVRAQRTGTFIAIFFIVASIYSTLELSTNPGIHVTVQQAAHQGGSHMGMEENIYIMQQAGILVAPWMLAFLAIGGLVQSGKANRLLPKIKKIFSAAATIAPITFVIWLVVSGFYMTQPKDMVHDHVLTLSMDVAAVFYFWLSLVLVALVVRGAPRFFSSLLPDFLSHDHSH